MKRALLAGALLVVCVGAAGWWWMSRASDPETWQGYVEAEYVRVSPTLTGRITGIAVARGDQVAAGAPLFTQDDADDKAARDAAAGKLAETQARLANLQTASRDTEIAQAEADLADLLATKDRIGKDLARNEELLKTGAASRQAVDQQRADLASANARANAANAKLEQMRSPTGRQYEIAAQSAMIAQAGAALAQAEWQLNQRRVSAPVGALVADTYARNRRDHNGRRSHRLAAAATEHPGALLRARDCARLRAPRRPIGDRLRWLRARTDCHGLVHRTAAGIHPAGDLQRVEPREARLSDRGTSVGGACDSAEAGTAG